MQLLNVWKVNYMDSVNVLLQLDTSCQQLLVTGLLKQTKKGEKTVATATLLCAPGCSDCVSALANSTCSPNITKEKEENKTRGILPHCHLPWVCHCGAGSILTAHYHPSVPVVAAMVADALYSSPLAGYRSADSQSCGIVWGVWGQASEGAGDEAGQTVGGSTQQLTVSHLLLGDTWFPPTIVGLVSVNGPDGNLTTGTSPPTAGMLGWEWDMFVEDLTGLPNDILYRP